MEQITNDPVSLVIGLALLIFIIFSMIKKVFKLIIVSILALVLYIAYLNYTGEKPPDFIEEIMDDNGESILKDIVVGDRFITPQENIDSSKLRFKYTPSGTK